MYWYLTIKTSSAADVSLDIVSHGEDNQVDLGYEHGVLEDTTKVTLDSTVVS